LLEYDEAYFKSMAKLEVKRKCFEKSAETGKKLAGMVAGFGKHLLSLGDVFTEDDNN